MILYYLPTVTPSIEEDYVISKVKADIFYCWFWVKSISGLRMPQSRDREMRILVRVGHNGKMMVNVNAVNNMCIGAVLVGRTLIMSYRIHEEGWPVPFLASHCISRIATRLLVSELKPGFHIVVSDGDASQSVEGRCYWDAYDDKGTYFWWCRRHPHCIADIQSRWEKLRSVELLRMSPMHRRHVPVDAGMSPSRTTIWKPGFTGTACASDRDPSTQYTSATTTRSLAQ